MAKITMAKKPIQVQTMNSSFFILMGTRPQDPHRYACSACGNSATIGPYKHPAFAHIVDEYREKVELKTVEERTIGRKLLMCHYCGTPLYNYVEDLKYLHHDVLRGNYGYSGDFKEETLKKLEEFYQVKFPKEREDINAYKLKRQQDLGPPYTFASDVEVIS
jgi:hypothetical protein